MQLIARFRFSRTILLALFACAWSGPVWSCSCVGGTQTASAVRAWAESLIENWENVVLVEAVDVVDVAEAHEQAKLKVVRAWKGSFAKGAVIQSDTPEIGAGMCNASIAVGERYLAFFDRLPIEVNGCPSDFVLTRLEARSLTMAARKRRNEAR